MSICSLCCLNALYFGLLTVLTPVALPCLVVICLYPKLLGETNKDTVTFFFFLLFLHILL